jgi:hypothetical protein
MFWVGGAAWVRRVVARRRVGILIMAGGSVGFVGGNEKPRAGVAGAGLILERVESLRGWLLGFF